MIAQFVQVMVVAQRLILANVWPIILVYSVISQCVGASMLQQPTFALLMVPVPQLILALAALIGLGSIAKPLNVWGLALQTYLFAQHTVLA